MMGEFDFSIDIDASQAFRILENLDNKVEDSKEKLINATKEVDRKTMESFQHVQSMMRASYMMVSGISQIIGGDMGRVFSAMYGMGVAMIGTFKSLAAAVAVSSPVGWIQAALMFTSLMSATIQLASISSGQTQLSQQMHGLTMSLHGIQGIIGGLNFL